MKIKIFCCLLFVFNFFFTKAQIQGTLSYKSVINDKLMSPNAINLIIYFNNSRSIEIGVKANIKSGKIDESSDMIVTDAKGLFILKDFKSKKIVLADYLGTKTYLINDTIPNFKWTITKSRKIILNFNCTKALVNFRGRNYIAWFTEDIPVQNGPWKFSGLPGLIVKVEDDQQIFSYELTGINLKAKFSNNIIAIPKVYIRGKAISQKEYIEQYNKKTQNNAKMARVLYLNKDGSHGTITEILPQKQEKF